MGRFSYSIVVLTYNRNHLLAPLIRELDRFTRAHAEIIVVDNCSTSAATEVTGTLPWITVIRAPRNLGAAGRNLGFNAARGDIVICLDDDIARLSEDAFDKLDVLFSDPQMAAVNFKVLDHQTNEIVNWVHHRDVEAFSDAAFDTYEITEGAVAFRRLAIHAIGGYSESFFLSHEGYDIALRLMNRDLRVTYSPDISVVHSFANEGRTSWRNYYFDTRNIIWLAIRNLPGIYGTKVVVRQCMAMLVLAIRDGYARWWAKGVIDGIGGIPTEVAARKCLSRSAFARVVAIDRYRPSMFFMLRKRLRQRGPKLQ